MSDVVVTVGPTHTLREAAVKMVERKTGAALVLDEEAYGPRIITERDILHAVAGEKNVDETKVEDGGLCVESSTNKCSDDFGEFFNLPSNGTWKRITVRWADPTFIQEGWGAVFPWNPAHVTSDALP